jgi:membrane protein implicated in regulation of membrane protease activity
MGRTAPRPDPKWSFPFVNARVTIRPVQQIAASRSVRPPVSAVVVGLLVGVALLAGGLFLAWLTFATPMVTALAPQTLRPSPAQMAMGGLVWGVALVAPPAFAFVGAWRLSRVARALTARPRPGLLTPAARQLGDDHTAIREVVLPDGRVIHDLVVGPFGVAVIADMPAPRYVRRTGMAWELKGPGGRWVHMENPLERASRDAERVKRWFGGTERDYTLKVYAALVTTDPTITRSPSCAVITKDQIPAWLLSLPPSRILNSDRREEIVERISSLL